MSMDENNKDPKQTLLELVRDAIRRDDALREKYQIGDKFRFVRDRLHALLNQLEQQVELLKPVEKQSKSTISKDDVLVYVYLFNVQGLVLKSWQNMLTPRLFYEYSVNRPIYLERAHVESLIRSKSNKAQHAFIAIAVKPQDILQGDESSWLKDIQGNRVIKVKEGAFHFSKCAFFSHNGMDYTLNDEGELVKK
jgi:hypothetical protein